MLKKLAFAMLAGWLACAPTGSPAFAQASADQLNKLSLESLTANPGGGSGGGSSYGYRSARPARRAFAIRHYRTPVRHTYAEHRYRTPVRRIARYETRRVRYRPTYAVHRVRFRPAYRRPAYHRSVYLGPIHRYGRTVHRTYYRAHPSYYRTR